MCLEDLDRCNNKLRTLLSPGLRSTYLHSDAVLGEDLQLRSVIGNKSVELLLVPVPLDAVQTVLLHVEVTLEDGLLKSLIMTRGMSLRTDLTNQLVTGNTELEQLQTN